MTEFRVWGLWHFGVYVGVPLLCETAVYPVEYFFWSSDDCPDLQHNTKGFLAFRGFLVASREVRNGKEHASQDRAWV